MSTNWRDGSIVPTALGIPCSAYLPLFGWLYFPSWTTFYVAVGIIICFGIMSKLGWTLNVCWNKFLGALRGKRIYARPWWMRKRYKDK